jgi:hypothetical protein
MRVLAQIEKAPHLPCPSEAPDYLFFCPGCKCGHGVWTTQPNKATGSRWTFNGDMERPTFSPSILLKTEILHGQVVSVCHSFVRDGKIQYLGDCTHALAGKTIDMVEI